jgi:hypothetical protein
MVALLLISKEKRAVRFTADSPFFIQQRDSDGGDSNGVSSGMRPG